MRRGCRDRSLIPNDMSPTVNHLIGLFVGFAVAELTVAHAGPMAFFGIPFTKKLMREDAVDGGRDILKAYKGVVLVLGGVYLVAFGVVVVMFPRILPGFIVGSLLLIAIRFRGWGYTLRNFDDYIRNHGPALKKDARKEQEKKGLPPPKGQGR